MRMHPFAIVILISLAVCNLAIAAPQVRELDMSRARVEGGILSGGRIAAAPTFRLPADGVLWAEAEAPSELRAPAVTAESAEASGGEYVVVPDQSFSGSTAGVTFSVEVSKPGTYALWARTYWPDIGGNSFYLQLDDGDATTWGNDEEPGHIRNWFWLEGPKWQLSAGVHRIAVRCREDGTQLDKIALGPPGFTPEGLGGDHSPVGLPETIRITFPALKPLQVERWLSARVDVTDAGAAPALSVALADGAEKALPADGDMSDIRVVDPRKSAVSLKVEVAPTSRTVIQGAQIEYDGAASTISVTDGNQEFVFDLATGELAAVRWVDGKREALVGNSGLPFRLQAWDPADKKLQWLDLTDATLVSTQLGSLQGTITGPTASLDRARGIVLTYSVPVAGGSCLVTCSAQFEDGASIPAWNVEVTNRTEALHIVEVEFPVIRNVALGRDGDDDWLTWPYWAGAGKLIPKPSMNAPGAGSYCSGRATMGWLDLYQKGEQAMGLYLASEDETWLMGNLRAQACPEVGAVELGISKMPRIKPGQAWKSGTFRCGLHEGDWHSGADVYREWIGQHVEYNPPQWVREADGWLGQGRGTNFLKDIPEHFRRAKSLGLDYVELWGQMTVGVGAGAGGCNRLYFPDPRYGTEADFAKAIGYVRDAGGHIGFYTNGQAWNPRYPELRPEYQGIFPDGVFIPDWEKEYHNYGLIGPDGSYISQYAPPSGDDRYPGSFFLMCPSTEGWPRYLHSYIVGKYVEQYGVDAMYIDQVGAATGQQCFAENHLHEQIGSWTQGHMDNFRKIKQDGQKTEREFALATEGFGDCYGRYVDMFLISPAACNTAQYLEPGVTRYTLPDRILFDGYANGNVGQVPDKEILNKVFLYGHRFDMFPRSPEAMEYFAKILRLRQETSQLLYRARYMDDVGLATIPEIPARWFALDPEQADGVLITMLNPDNLEGATISVPWKAEGTPRAYLATLDQMLTPAACEVEAGNVRVPVPAEPVATVLVLSDVRMEPQALLRLASPVGAAGAPSQIVLRYRPIGEMTPGAARVDVEAPEGWTAAGAEFDATKAADVPLLIAPGTGERGAFPIEAAVSLPGGRTIRFPTRLLLHDALEARLTLTSSAVNVSVRSNAAGALKASCRLQTPAWLALAQAEQQFEVPAHGLVELSFPLAVAAQARTRGVVEATLKVGNGTSMATLDVGPPEMTAANWQLCKYSGDTSGSVENGGTSDEMLVVKTLTQSDRGGWQWRSQSLPPSTTWTFSGQVKTEKMQAKDGGAKARIICFDARNSQRGTRPTIFTDSITGDTDWTDFRVVLDVPEHTGTVQIELFNWCAGGTSYWRNLRIE